MKVLAWRGLALVAVALALPLFSQSAKATEIDFACFNPLVCNGTVTNNITGSAPTFTVVSTSGNVSVIDLSAPGAPDLLDTFNLTFSYNQFTGGTVTFTDITNPGDVASGTIAAGGAAGNVLGGVTLVTLAVDFTSLPLDFQTYLGTTTGIGGVTDINISTNTASQVSASIGATPEPASYLLMGTGMLLCAFFLRRHMGTTSAVTVA